MAAAAIRIAGISRGRVAGGVDFFEGFLQFGARGGEVLEKLDLVGELDDKSLILRRGEHLVKEGAAGAALLIENVALREAGVDQKAEGEGKIRVLIEVADGLGMSVYLEDEVVFGEVLDERSFLVADDGRDIHKACVDGERWGSRSGSCWPVQHRTRGCLLSEEVCGQDQGKRGSEKPRQAQEGHVGLDETGGGGFHQGVKG